MRFCRSHIMEIRALTGLSQEYTAGMLDVSRTVIAMYEAGGRGMATHAMLHGKKNCSELPCAAAT